jgi:hypothetical protein
MSFCSLVEMFTGNLFERLLSAGRTGKGLDNRDEVVDHNSNDADELLISVIGPLLWSKSHFELPRPPSDDDGESGSDDDNQVNSNISRKTEETESHNDDIDSNKRKRRKVATTRMSASQVCYELSKANVSPHLLIAPHVYGESFGAGSSASQPFRITVHPQVIRKK